MHVTLYFGVLPEDITGLARKGAAHFPLSILG